MVLVYLPGGTAAFADSPDGFMIDSVTLYVAPPLDGIDSLDWNPFVSTVGDGGYYSSEESWCDASGAPLEENITFVAGETYYISLKVVAEDGNWWKQFDEGVEVIVDGGTFVSGGSVNSTEGCWYDMVIATTAVAVPEGLITDLELGFEPPEVGDEISVTSSDSGIIQEPAPQLTAPDGAHYTISADPGPMWLEDDELGSDIRTESFEIEEGTDYCFTFTIEPESGYYFDGIYTNRSVDNAYPMRSSIYADGRLEASYFFTTEGGSVPVDEYDYFSVWMCDKDHAVNTGGGVLIEYVLPDGDIPADSGAYWDCSTNQTVTSGSFVTLTAVPAEGYIFKGWYQANVNKQSPEDPHYLEDKLIYEGNSYSFIGNPCGEGEPPYICAVFEEGESRQADQIQVWVGNPDASRPNNTAMGGKVAVNYKPSEPNIYDLRTLDGTNYVYGEVVQFYVGDEITAYAKPDEGYAFKGWYHVNIDWHPGETNSYEGEVISTSDSFTYKPAVTVLPGDSEPLRYVCAVFEESTGPGPEPETEVIRFAGSNRYETGILAAEHLKEKNGVSAFDNIIIASGADFPDALSATYLAYVKNAPILLVGKDSGSIAKITAYANANLAAGGKVYIVGGEGAVLPAVDSALTVDHKRLAGSNRYKTNLAVLDEAGLAGKDMLVASGKGYADALSSSAAGKPILLVADALTPEQKTFLSSNSENYGSKFYIIGGTGAVSEAVESGLAEYRASPVRLAGNNRYDTSRLVAETFFTGEYDTMVIASGKGFPDGLSGGPVAAAYGAPLLLVADGATGHAGKIFDAKGLSRLVVMGGTGAVSEAAVNAIKDYKAE